MNTNYKHITHASFIRNYKIARATGLLPPRAFIYAKAMFNQSQSV